MAEYTFDTDLFSDFYKEVNGFRPRSHRFYDDETTDDERQEIWDVLMMDMDREFEYQRQEEANAISEFEAKINETINLGAGDRNTALRWLLSNVAEQHHNDAGYVCYLMRLPYSYEQEFSVILGEMFEENSGMNL